MDDAVTTIFLLLQFSLPTSPLLAKNISAPNSRVVSAALASSKALKNAEPNILLCLEIEGMACLRPSLFVYFWDVIGAFKEREKKVVVKKKSKLFLESW